MHRRRLGRALPGVLRVIRRRPCSQWTIVFAVAAVALTGCSESSGGESESGIATCENFECLEMREIDRRARDLAKSFTISGFHIARVVVWAEPDARVVLNF